MIRPHPTSPVHTSSALTLLPLMAWLAVFLTAGTGFWVLFDTQAQFQVLATAHSPTRAMQTAVTPITTSHMTLLMVVTVLCLLLVALASLQTQAQLSRQFEALRSAAIQAQAAAEWPALPPVSAAPAAELAQRKLTLAWPPRDARHG